MAGHQVEARQSGVHVLDDAVLELGHLGALAFVLDFEHVGHGAAVILPFPPAFLGDQTQRGVGLRVEIHEQHAFLMFLGEVGSEIDGAGGLADAAFHLD